MPDWTYRVVCRDCDFNLGVANMSEARETVRGHETTNPHTADIKDGASA